MHVILIIIAPCHKWIGAVACRLARIGYNFITFDDRKDLRHE